MATKENILLISAVAGAALSLVWIIYAVIQQRRNERIQRAIVQTLNKDVDQLDVLLNRLRNLEISQCSNPAISSNPKLASLLNCPAPAALISTAPSVVAGQVSPSSPLSQMTTQQMMQSAPGFGVRVGNQVVSAVPPNMPPLPNYGFFGNGPAGLSEQFQHPQQQLLTSGSIPVPFR
jgi:hypothetical protein